MIFVTILESLRFIINIGEVLFFEVKEDFYKTI